MDGYTAVTIFRGRWVLVQRRDKLEGTVIDEPPDQYSFRPCWNPGQIKIGLG